MNHLKIAQIDSLPRFSQTLYGVMSYVPRLADETITLELGRTEPPIPYRVTTAIETSANWNYPDTSDLQNAFAVRFGVRSANVLITAGADEAIDRICRAFLQNEDAELLTLSPTFEMIARYATLAAATCRAAHWMEDAFPLEEILARCSVQTKLIALVTPNNPTGRVIPLDAIITIATSFPSIPILVDLAYIEFAASDPSRDLLRFENIIMVRTLSKAYGLPGIRIGCAIGSERIIEGLNRSAGPYSVSSLSTRIAIEALQQDHAVVRNYVELVRTEREEFCELLTLSDLTYLPSESNFVLLRVKEAIDFDRAMRDSAIGTRAFPNDRQLTNMRRITMPGNPDAFARLKQAIMNATNSSRQ